MANSIHACDLLPGLPVQLVSGFRSHFDSSLFWGSSLHTQCSVHMSDDDDEEDSAENEDAQRNRCDLSAFELSQKLIPHARFTGISICRYSPADGIESSPKSSNKNKKKLWKR